MISSLLSTEPKKKKKNYMQLDSQKKGTNIIGRVPITCFVGLFFFFKGDARPSLRMASGFTIDHPGERI